MQWFFPGQLFLCVYVVKKFELVDQCSCISKEWNNSKFCNQSINPRSQSEEVLEWPKPCYPTRRSTTIPTGFGLGLDLRSGWGSGFKFEILVVDFQSWNFHISLSYSSSGRVFATWNLGKMAYNEADILKVDWGISVGSRVAGGWRPLIIRWPDKVITRLSGYRLSLNSIAFWIIFSNP